MDNCDPTNLPDVPDIPASIIESGIADQSLTSLVEAAMQKLIAAGVPIDRMNVGCRILHPLFDGMSMPSFLLATMAGRRPALRL